MAGMKCGDFLRKARTRVQVQSQSNVTDAYGGRTTAWGTILNAYAWVRPASGREVFQTEANESRVTHKIVLRYSSNLNDTATTGSYRVLVGGRVHAVKLVKNLHWNMADYGTYYQELQTEENYPEAQ